MEFDDGTVDAGCQAKIVGVHDESLHSVECINFDPASRLQGFAGMIRDKAGHGLVRMERADSSVG